MTFEEDLTKRRINVVAFAAGDPERYAAWRMLYEQVHPNTFYTSVKMVINDVRRQFWLAEVPKPAVATAPAAAKPVMRRATGSVPASASAIPDEPSPTANRTPEPAPRTRPIIRKPSVPSAAVPEEKEQDQNKSVATENAIITPETPKPGRARPVFRRPTTETTANASDQNTTVPEDKATVAPETANSLTDTPKPPRPRPVFRKPVTPENEATNTDKAGEVPAEANTASLPEHSNPNPSEASKPPRPRPVFKRPTSATTPEPEKTAATPEAPGTVANSTDDLVNTPEEKSGSVTPEAPKPPRPRPIFKRPGTTAPEQNATETASEPIAESNPEALSETEKPKFPRPRPIIKRPAPSTETPVTEPLPENLPEASQPEQEIKNFKNNTQEQVGNEPGSLLTSPEDVPDVPVPPKTSRPRPIFKRPTPGANAEPSNDKPAAE